MTSGGLIPILVMIRILRILTCLVTQAIQDIHITDSSKHRRPQYSEDASSGNISVARYS